MPCIRRWGYKQNFEEKKYNIYSGQWEFIKGEGRII